jgi:hypothetical protein
LITLQKIFKNIHTPFLQFWCGFSWHLPCTHFVALEYIVHIMASTAMANTKFQGSFIICNATVFSYHSFTVLNSL